MGIRRGRGVSTAGGAVGKTATSAAMWALGHVDNHARINTEPTY